MQQQTHTNDIGVAIRDGLDLICDGIERVAWNGDERDENADQPIDPVAITVSNNGDPSNLTVVTSLGETFRVSVTRVG
jgi:hypothetical protein